MNIEHLTHKQREQARMAQAGCEMLGVMIEWMSRRHQAPQRWYAGVVKPSQKEPLRVFLWGTRRRLEALTFAELIDAIMDAAIELSKEAG